MAVLTRRPNSTVTGGTASLPGGGTMHGVLADDSDLTWIQIDPSDTNPIVGVEDPAPGLPAGAVVKSLAVRIRGDSGAANDYPSQVTVWLYDDGATIFSGTSMLGRFFATINLGSVDLDSVPAGVTAEIDSWLQQSEVRELYLDYTYVPLPVPNITSPSGTLNDDNEPTITWTHTTLDADGGPQTHYRVVVMANGDDPDVDTPIADSGEQLGADTSWTVEDPLADATYDIYVKVAQTVNGNEHWSDWDQQADVIIDVDVPADPTLVFSAENAIGAVGIEITAGVGGVVSTDKFQVQRQLGTGAYEYVATVEGNGFVTPVGGVATLNDYEARNGVTEDYRVRAVHEFGSGSLSYSAWVEGQGGWASDDWWFKSLTMPSLNMVVVPRSQANKQTGARQAVHKVVGRRDPVVVSDVDDTDSGDFVLRLDTNAERDALDVLLRSRVPILIQSPAAAYWKDRWVRFSTQSEDRVVDASWFPTTFDSLPWVEVAKPGGGILSEPDPNFALGEGDDVILV